MSISYDEAKNLINKGKKLKDGGSQILEKTMKPMYASDGKVTRIKKGDTGKAKLGQFKNIANASAKGKISPEKAEKMIRKVVLSKKDGGGFPDLSGDGKTTMKDVLIGRGVIKKSRGGGIAIQGLGFKGVR